MKASRLFISTQIVYKFANEQVDLTLHDQSSVKLLGCDFIMPKTTVCLQFLPTGIRLVFLEDLSSHIKDIPLTQE